MSTQQNPADFYQKLFFQYICNIQKKKIYSGRDHIINQAGHSSKKSSNHIQ